MHYSFVPEEEFEVAGGVMVVTVGAVDLAAHGEEDPVVTPEVRFVVVVVPVLGSEVGGVVIKFHRAPWCETG